MAGLSQEKLGGILGVQRTTVASWESGRNNPGPDEIKTIAVACNVTADWLLDMPVDMTGLPPDIRQLAEQIATLPNADREVLVKILNALRFEAESGKSSHS